MTTHDPTGACRPAPALEPLAFHSPSPAPECSTELPSDVVEILRVRTAIGASYLTGRGIEVGAGVRPFPVPSSVKICYGDIRDGAALETYFKTSVKEGAHINAQTFAEAEQNSLDFVILAHVIEHLRDPMGSNVNAIRVLKPHGVHILIVPDMRFTFDRNRPETTLAHIRADFADGGAGTTRFAYEEHLRFVHPYLTGEHYPEAEIQWQVEEGARRWQELDIHFHAWTRNGFEALLEAVAEIAPFSVEAAVSVVNENIFVLRKDSCPT